MSKLLMHPSQAGTVGRVHAITPESAGWQYVGFEVYRLAPGQVLARRVPGGREACAVIVAGRAQVGAGGQELGTLGERASPFEGSPWSLYAPHGFDLYYLNVMAGPRRAWRFRFDADQQWLLDRYPRAETVTPRYNPEGTQP